MAEDKKDTKAKKAAPAAKKAAAKKPAKKAEKKPAAKKESAQKDAAPKKEKAAKKPAAKKPAAKKPAAKKEPAKKAAPQPPAAPPVVRAKARYVRIAPRKARLVADQVRGLHIEQARALLQFSPRGAARDI